MKRESGPIGTLGPSKSTHIIGAGISGLLIGYYLKKAGHQVTIYEKNIIGGKISTKETTTGLVETAANAIFTNTDVIELLEELKLPFISANKPLKKKLWRYGKPRSFPLAPWELLRLFFGLFKRFPKDLSSLSVFDFFKPMLGERPAYEVLSAVLGGIYASSSKELHFKSIFKVEPKGRTYFSFIKSMIASRKASGHRPASISFEGGMRSFVDALKKELDGHFEMRQKVEIDKSVNTIICADATEAAQLLEASSPEISDQLKLIDYKPLSTGTFFFKKPAQNLEGSFGILFPPGTGFSCLGILNNSAIFKNRTKDQGSRSYTFITPSADFGEQNACEELEKLDGDNFNLQHLIGSKQTHWQRGIPVYNEARFRAISRLRAKMHGQAPGVVLFGNYVDGISIREMVSGAKSFAASN